MTAAPLLLGDAANFVTSLSLSRSCVREPGHPKHTMSERTKLPKQAHGLGMGQDLQLELRAGLKPETTREILTGYSRRN